MLFTYPPGDQLDRVLTAAKAFAGSAWDGTAEFTFNERDFVAWRSSNLAQMCCQYYNTTSGRIGPCRSTCDQPHINPEILATWPEEERAAAKRTIAQLHA